MAANSKIEWTEATWNPVAGCSVVSPGCTNCYAMRMAARIERMNPKLGHYRGLTQPSKAGPVWTGKIGIAPNHVLLAPPRRRKPTMYFVNSMSDLFHEDVPDEWIDRVFAVMALCPQHTFQCLTKHSARMRAYFATIASEAIAAGEDTSAAPRRLDRIACELSGSPCAAGFIEDQPWPLPNVWLGVSAEDQRRADERIPDLLATPAAVRWVSAEPLLGGINFGKAKGLPIYWEGHDKIELTSFGRHIGSRTGQGWAKHSGNMHPWLDWIVVGGESGPRARPNWAPNVRSIVRQCRAADVPVFVKQMGDNVEDRNDAGFEGCDPREWHLDDELAQVEHDINGYREEYQGAPVRIRLLDRKGGDMAEWPSDLRVRQMPKAIEA